MGESLFSHSWDKDAILEGEDEIAADWSCHPEIKPRDHPEATLSYFWYL